MKKIVLIYGSIAGLIVSVFLCIGFGTELGNMETGQLLGYATMILAFVSIFIGAKKYRDNDSEGLISFGKAFQVGLGITLVATIFYVVSWMIISETIAADYMEQYTATAIEKIQLSELSLEDKDAQIADLEYWKEAYKNPFVKIGITILEILPVGLIVSLITAFILKKNNNNSITNSVLV